MEEFRNRPYYARMEFATVQSDVEDMQKRGFSVKIMHEVFTKEGRLTMAYQTFCDYVRGGGQRLHGRKKDSPKQPPNANKASATPAASKRFAPADKSEPFRVERIPLEDLI